MSLDKLREQLAGLRDEERSKWVLVENKQDELRSARDDYRRTRGRAESLAKYIHDLDGQERDCPRHEYVAGPSGRGIGFDERCRHCGYFRTLHPVF